MVSFWQRAFRVAAGFLALVVAGQAIAGRITSAPGRVELTADERAWVGAHPVVRVVALDNYAPYLVTESGGRLAGLSVNLIDLIAQRTGLRFEYHKHQSVASALAEFKTGGGDLLPALARSPEREAFALFSQPYAAAFAVLVTRVDSPYHNSLAELDGLRVGSLRGSVQSQLISATAPGCRLVEYDSVKESLVGLAAGEVDATYASVGTAAYYLKHLQLSNLRLGSVVGQPTDLHVGVRKDWPVLAGIIDKALASVTPEERKKLDDQWIFVAQAPNRWLPWLRVVGAVAAVAVVVALLLWYFYQRLARELAARRRIQAELERAHVDLARVSEEKSEMMSSIAHDLRSPATGLLLSSELLLTMVDPANQPALDTLATQREACRKMIARVDELVNPHVQETGRRPMAWVQLDFVGLVRASLAEAAGAAAAKGITLDFRPESPAMLLLTDKAALLHVVDNLISNAIKYSARPSTVAVELVRQEGGYVLHVTDQGPGVPAAEREAIFGRFARGSALPTAGEKSTGLGLWIVRRTLQALHGRVWCGPARLGSGATFSAHLPLRPPAAGAPA